MTGFLTQTQSFMNLGDFPDLELKLKWSWPSSLSVTAAVSLSWQETQRNELFSISKCKDYTLKHPQCCCFTDVHRYLFSLLLQFMSKPDCAIM